MKTKILVVLLLASAELVQADQFKVRYPIHGSGKDIIVNATDDTWYTVEDIFPDAVVRSQVHRGKVKLGCSGFYLLAVLLMYSLTRKAFLSICLGVLISIVLAIAGSFVGL